MKFSPQELDWRILKALCAGLVVICGLFTLSTAPTAEARSNVTPWTTELSFQNLVYGASSTVDVVNVMGTPPDEIVKSEQMYPVIENFYYYDPEKSGSATVFIFEAGLLVGLQLRTASNQFVDLTYMLPNNGDRRLNWPLNGGYRSFFTGTNMPMTWFRQ